MTIKKSNRHLDYLREKFKSLNLTDNQIGYVSLFLIDYLMDNVTEAAIDCGAYHNMPANGDKNMIESYRSILWAMYEEINGDTPEPEGPWVAIDPVNGITVHQQRPKYVL